MALSLPTFPTWLWKNPNNDPGLDSNSNSNSNPLSSPNPNPNAHLTLSSQDSQYTILDGEPNYQYQWINPNPNHNHNTNPNPIYHHNPKSGEGKNLYGAWNRNYREFHTNWPQKDPYHHVRRQTNYWPRKISNFDLDLDLDHDLDVVLVPSPLPLSDHNWSSSESEGSDWSVGWFEPHGPEFCANNKNNEDNNNYRTDEDESENSFAVLVPCYGAGHAPAHTRPHSSSNFPAQLDSESKSQVWAAVLSNIANDPHSGTNYYLQQWLSSLQS